MYSFSYLEPVCCPMSNHSVVSKSLGLGRTYYRIWASQVTQMINILLAMQETWVWPLGHEDPLTCLLRNLYAGQETTVRTGHGTTDWFQIGKGVPQGCILSPCLFNLYAEYIMRNAGLEEAQLGSRLPGEISITSDMQITPPLWQKVKRN